MKNKHINILCIMLFAISPGFLPAMKPAFSKGKSPVVQGPQTKSGQSPQIAHKSSRAAVAANSAKQAAIKAATAVYNAPGYLAKVLSGKNAEGQYNYHGKFITGEKGSLRSATKYDTYNWNANKAGQQGWNFTTLANKNYKKPVSAYMQEKGLTFKKNGPNKGMPTYKAKENSTAPQKIRKLNKESIRNGQPAIDITPIQQKPSIQKKNNKNNNETPIQFEPSFPKQKREIKPPSQKSSKKSSIDYVTPLENTSLKSLFNQPKGISQNVTQKTPLSREAQTYKKDNSRLKTSKNNRVAEKNKAQSQAKWGSYLAKNVSVKQKIIPAVKTIKTEPKQLKPIVSENQTISKTSKLNISSEKMSNNGSKEFAVMNIQPVKKSRLEAQQNQVAIIPGQGVRNYAPQKNFRQLNKESVQHGQTKIAKQNKNQTQQKAKESVSKKFEYEKIYTNAAEAKISHPIQQFTGNAHLKNYSKNSRAKLEQQKQVLEKQEAAKNRDVTFEYKEAYPNNKGYSDAPQYKTPSRTPIATESIGSQIRSANPLSNVTQSLNHKAIYSNKKSSSIPTESNPLKTVTKNEKYNYATNSYVPWRKDSALLQTAVGKKINRNQSPITVVDQVSN